MANESRSKAAFVDPRTGESVARSNVWLFPPEDLTIIGLDTDDTDSHALYDSRIHLPVDPAMVASIAFDGIKQPILIRKNGTRVEVVVGRQRVRAAREANKLLLEQGKEPVRVPALPARGEDHDLFGVMITENEIRRGDDPLTKAYKLQKYLNMGRTNEEAMVRFGVSAMTISNWLNLLELHPKVQALVKQSKLASSAVLIFKDLPLEDQPAAAEAALNIAAELDELPSARHTKAVLHHLQALPASRPATPAPAPLAAPADAGGATSETTSEATPTLTPTREPTGATPTPTTPSTPAPPAPGPAPPVPVPPGQRKVKQVFDAIVGNRVESSQGFGPQSISEQALATLRWVVTGELPDDEVGLHDILQNWKG